VPAVGGRGTGCCRDRHGAADGARLPDRWALAERHWPGVRAWFAARGDFSFWLPAVYSIAKAEHLLGWEPRRTFDRWWREERPAVA